MLEAMLHMTNRLPRHHLPRRFSRSRVDSGTDLPCNSARQYVIPPLNLDPPCETTTPLQHFQTNIDRGSARCKVGSDFAKI